MLSTILESANNGPIIEESETEVAENATPEKKVETPEKKEQQKPQDVEEAEDAAAMADPEKLPKNFRFRTEDPKTQRFLKLMKQNPDKTPDQLLELAGFAPAKASQPKEEAASDERAAYVETVVPTSQRITDAETKVSELTDKLKKAEENYEPTAGILSDLQDAKLDLREAKQDARAEAYEAQVFESSRQSSIAKAHELSKEASQAGTPQYEEIQREVAWLDQHKPDLLSSPDYPMEVLKRVAARRPDLFPNVVKRDTPVAQVKQPVKTAPPARPTGEVEVGGATAATNPPNAQEAARMLDDMSLEQLEAIANSTGTQGGRR